MDPHFLFRYLGICLEAFFFGIYSAIFIMYIQCHASKKGSDTRKSILFFAICVLYILCTVTFIFDTAGVGFLEIQNLEPNPSLAKFRMVYDIGVTEILVIGCYGFIAQSILIYRYWIVWGHNIRVVILPIILAFACLATWVAALASISVPKSVNELAPPRARWLILSSVAASMTVNTLVTGLIVFKIFKVFREDKILISRDATTLGSSTHGTRLQSIIFILIESGAVLFCNQLVRLTTIILVTNTIALNVFLLTIGIYQMLEGITPTIILVRVSMGLSFHDEKSLVNATMHFYPRETESAPRMIRNYLDDDFKENINIEMPEKSVDGSSGSRSLSDGMSGALAGPSMNNGSASSDGTSTI